MPAAVCSIAIASSIVVGGVACSRIILALPLGFVDPPYRPKRQAEGRAAPKLVRYEANRGSAAAARRYGRLLGREGEVRHDLSSRALRRFVARFVPRPRRLQQWRERQRQRRQRR